MKTLRPWVAIAIATTLARCATSPSATSPAPAGEPVTPADFVAAIADVAAGRNAAMAETGLVLKRIEFKLLVGTQTKGGGKIEILLLDADISRSSETAFTEDLTLEIPEITSKRIAPAPLVPGVREFVDAAMNTARDLARAASAAGLPQQLHSVELTARITRSTNASGGINATIPAWVKPSVGADVSRAHEDDNTVRLIFEARPGAAR